MIAGDLRRWDRVAVPLVELLPVGLRRLGAVCKLVIYRQGIGDRAIDDRFRYRFPRHFPVDRGLIRLVAGYCRGGDRVGIPPGQLRLIRFRRRGPVRVLVANRQGVDRGIGNDFGQSLPWHLPGYRELVRTVAGDCRGGDVVDKPGGVLESDLRGCLGAVRVLYFTFRS